MLNQINALAAATSPQATEPLAITAFSEALHIKDRLPPDWTPLAKESRTHVTTAVMCAHLGRKPQTARVWACRENGPIRPIRVNGRLAWPVSEIRRLLGVAA